MEGLALRMASSSGESLAGAMSPLSMRALISSNVFGGTESGVLSPSTLQGAPSDSFALSFTGVYSRAAGTV